MPDRRVVITGLGVATPAGLGIGPFWQAVLEARSFIKPIDLFDATGFACRLGGQLDNFSATKFVPKDYRKAVKVMARDIEIAVAAADLAFRDSGIVTRGLGAEPTVDSKRLGCNIGAGLICTDLDELGGAVNSATVNGKFDLKVWGAVGMQNLTPLWLLKYLPNMLACHVTIIHGAEAPSNTITCGDASAMLAVGEATRLIARGGADVVVAGGAESKLNPMGLVRQGLLRRLCETGLENPSAACRPFDRAHAGTIIGEGGGLLILEEMERAKARGAKIYAELVGFGGACDPNGIDVLTPTAGGLDGAVKRAMTDAAVRPKDIGLILAHGTAVPGEDECESRAWKAALDGAAETIPAASLTGAVGSLFAGAGGVALAAAAMAVYTGTVPPTANFSACADGACRLNLSGAPRSADVKYAAVGAFTIGGQSGACILKKYEA